MIPPAAARPIHDCRDYRIGVSPAICAGLTMPNLPARMPFQGVSVSVSIFDVYHFRCNLLFALVQRCRLASPARVEDRRAHVSLGRYEHHVIRHKVRFGQASWNVSLAMPPRQSRMISLATGDKLLPINSMTAGVRASVLPFVGETSPEAKARPRGRTHNSTAAKSCRLSAGRGCGPIHNGR